jgi:hypothetical protein
MNRNLVPLVVKYGEFLNLVRNQGKGTMKLNYIQDKIAEVVITNQEKKNCITGSMMFQFAEIIDQLSRDLDTYSSLFYLSWRGIRNV